MNKSDSDNKNSRQEPEPWDSDPVEEKIPFVKEMPTLEGYGIDPKELAEWEETLKHWEEKKKATEKKTLIISGLLSAAFTFFVLYFYIKINTFQNEFLEIALGILLLVLVGLFSYHILNLLLVVLLEIPFSIFRPKSKIGIQHQKYQADLRNYKYWQKQEALKQKKHERD